MIAPEEYYAIENQYTQKIDNLPDVPFPAGTSSATEYFVSLVEAGVRYRYGEPAFEVRQRVQLEMDAILSARFEKYFLIWWKIAAICRENEIFYFCAGEANSSIICYILEITDIDPLKHNLLFECFFNSKKHSPFGWSSENAEISFCVSKNIIQYLKDNFGSDCVFIDMDKKCSDKITPVEIIITKKPVEEKEDFFCFSFIMPGEKDSDWSKFSLISSSSFHAISYSDPKTINQVKEKWEDLCSKYHLRKQLIELKGNSFSDLLIMEAITYFDDDVAKAIISDLIKRKSIEYKPLFKGAEKILDETYGRILFEEQFILLVQLITGWDIEKAYSFMLEMESNHIITKYTKYTCEFMACAEKAGFSQKAAEELYNTLIEASDNLMEKAFILPWVQEWWRELYLKAHYPSVFISKE